MKCARMCDNEKKMDYCIAINQVTKRFGEQTVLNAVSAPLEAGQTPGLVGRNGSGKTVLMKCILGFIPVSEGESGVQVAPSS